MWRKTGVATVVGLMALSVWATEPWKDKAFKDWDENDIRKTLNESPWAKRISVDAGWRSGFAAIPAGPSSVFVPTLPGGSSSEDASADQGSSPPIFAAGHEELQGLRAEFVILWTSSRTVRTAMARSAVLRGTAEESDAERYLSRQPDDYQVLVQGADMTPFAKEDEKSLQKKAVLFSKTFNRKLTPTEVGIQRSADGKRITAVVFYFPKNDSRGTPTLAPEETSIEFRCETHYAKFRTNFQPQKMMDKLGLDL